MRLFSALQAVVGLTVIINNIGLAAADCACGYRGEYCGGAPFRLYPCTFSDTALHSSLTSTDPFTNALWTDSLITYFNETGAAEDVVFLPSSSPSVNGQIAGGDTGNGTQAWSAVQYLNDYNDGFHSLWRTGVNFNNTYINSSRQLSQGLQLAVQPADTRNRITYGGALVTRRTDIQYGSLRISVRPPNFGQGGTMLEMGVHYNESEYLSTTMVLSAENASVSSLEWAYSARDVNADPISQNISVALGDATYSDFYEHRMEWLGSDALRFSNDGDHSAEGSLASAAYTVKENSTNIPVVGGPVSISHYSSGNSDQDQKPPQFHQPVVDVLYARLFFNSSLRSRRDDFDAACAEAGYEEVCNTEDQTLRGSTLFSIASMAFVEAPTFSPPRPLWSVILMSVCGGIFVLFLAHSVALRKLGKLEATDNRPSVEQATDPAPQMSAPVSVKDNMTPSSSTSSPSRLSTDAARWEDPTFLATAALDWGKDDDEDDSDFEKLASDDEGEDQDDPFAIRSRPTSVLSFGLCSFIRYTQDGLPEVQYARPKVALTQSMNSMQAFALPQHLGMTIDEKGSLHSGESNFIPTISSPASRISISETEDLVAELRHATAAIDDRTKSDPRPPNSIISSPGGGSSRQSTMSLSSDLPSTYRSMAITQRHPAMHRRVFLSDGEEEAPEWKTPILEWKVGPADAGGQRALPVAAQPAAVAAEAAAERVSWLKRTLKSFFVEESEKATASGAARVEYLDGLRGFACFLVSFHHFMLIFYYGSRREMTKGDPMHYPGMETWFRRILGTILTNGGLNVGIFFCLAARVIANRYMVRGRLQDLAEATHRRVPRLMVPISTALVMNYFLIEADAFHWVRRLASRTWSPWSYYNDYQNLGVFLNDFFILWFTDPPNVPPQLTTYATGILWTVPIIVQASWTVFTCALIAREMPNAKKRYAFYAVCFIISWYVGRFDYFFIAGVVIADLDNRLQYRALAQKGFPVLPEALRKRLPLPKRLSQVRIHGQIFGWIILLCGAVVSWMETIKGTGADIPGLEHGVHPWWPTAEPKGWAADSNKTLYTDARFFDFLFVIGFFLLCDLCTTFRNFFQLRFWSIFGRNAFALYLLHGVVFWSWGAFLCLKLLVAGVPYWASVLIVFITSYGILIILCEGFSRTFDAWGVSVSKSLWRVTSGGLGRRL